ncbi:PAS domain-containing sensor histidine kinase [Geotalea sp. SG265]|uniref:PAS domain-containing sensor histidine kinase n=1 Tax=Geotalea sp. SG265 TaxID=2922867 RepID=UPI001FAFA49C|nr:PAS domain-containing sensor histidine kinase [Geotalea sp. SG265]
MSELVEVTKRTPLPAVKKRDITAAAGDSRRKILLNSAIPAIIEAIPDYVLVLDRQYQVLAVNTRLLDAFGLDDPQMLIGLKPGEALHCIHAEQNPDGCGTGKHCQKCAAVLSIIESEQANAQVVKEYRITIDNGQWSALDLEVVVSPLQIGDLQLILFVMRDISAEKRRKVLEQVFFHDVINTAGGIRGMAEVLAKGMLPTADEEKYYKESMVSLSAKLIDEIVYQRHLLAAEKGEFRPDPGMVEVAKLLKEVQTLFANHDVAEGRNLVLNCSTGTSIVTDAAILRRILGNMIKNALEACNKGETVTLSCTEDTESITFMVNNPGVMSDDVQLQLFQRSFSTKAAEGRGIGTYSIKLFGERYLKGNISFTSNEQEGTTFRFTIPRYLSVKGEKGEG